MSEEKEDTVRREAVHSHESPFIGMYDRSVLLTYLGVVFAIIGICMVFRGEIGWSVICLIVAGACDVLDGTVARSCKWRTDEQKTYGIQMDSLADTVSFVILPVVISIGMGHDDIISIIVCAIYALAGLIRLGYFNVQAMKSDVEVYTGLPVTTVAAVLPFLWLAYMYADEMWATVAFDAVMALMAMLFVSRIRIVKPGKYLQYACALLAVFGIAIILFLQS